MSAKQGAPVGMRRRGRGRDYSLDCLRIAAAFLVVLIHTSARYWHTDINQDLWVAANCYSLTAHIAVPLFLMISGALFLSRPTLDLKRFLSKNLVTIVLIYVAWNAFYAFAAVTNNFENMSTLMGGGALAELISRFAEGKFHLWYLRALILIYLLVPIVHAAIHKTGVSPVYCTVVAACIAAPVIISKSFVGIPKPIDTFISGFHLGYVPLIIYLLFGYLLTRATRLRNAPLPVLLVSWLALTLVAVVASTIYSHEMGKPEAWLFDNLALNMIIQACLFFLMFCKLGAKKGQEWRHGKLIQYLSGITLGIYLIHPLFIAIFERFGISAVGFNPFVSIPILALLIFVASGVATALLKLIPGVRRLV